MLLVNHSVSQQEWRQIGAGIHVKPLLVNEPKFTVEFLLKEDSSWKPGLHRHLCDTSMFVIQGTITNLTTGITYGPGDFFHQQFINTHCERIGDGLMAYLCMRGRSNTLVEFLGDQQEVLGAVKVSDFSRLLTDTAK